MQQTVLPEMLQVRVLFAHTVAVQVLLQPLPLVMVTVNVPAPTVIHCVVAPVLHK